MPVAMSTKSSEQRKKSFPKNIGKLTMHGREQRVRGRVVGEVGVKAVVKDRPPLLLMLMRSLTLP